MQYIYRLYNIISIACAYDLPKVYEIKKPAKDDSVKSVKVINLVKYRYITEC